MGLNPKQKRQKKPTLDPAELERLKGLLCFEEEALKAGYKAVAGIDEAGRGPLAGPVVAAACHLPPGVLVPDADDSKKLTPAKRAYIYNQVINDTAIKYGIGVVDAVEIDSINIYQATLLAMRRALANMTMAPDCLLVDGMALNYKGIPSLKIIKGDSRSLSIAVASIIAKQFRDLLMGQYEKLWPGYGFATHKGYGTLAHRKEMALRGLTPIHRKTFKTDLEQFAEQSATIT